MNYGTCAEAQMCDENKMVAPGASLTDTLRETSNIAGDLLAMSYRINGHLFGGVNIPNDKNGTPGCFQDEMENVKCKLLEMANVLSEICARLGV